MNIGKALQLKPVLRCLERLATGHGRVAVGTCRIGGAGSGYGNKRKEPRLLPASNTYYTASKPYSALVNKLQRQRVSEKKTKF
jgi:hypothetical protein